MLALFDIDGTLLRRAGPAHRDALVAAVREVLGVETRNDNIALHGKLDPDILLEMMANAGVPPRRGRRCLPALYRAAERYYLSCPADLRDKTCPGVRPLLAASEERRVLLGLVTGNLTRIGWKKLERADLDQHFLFGAFGEMAPTRAELTALALRHARQWGWDPGLSRAVLIGDTPNDVEAGRAHGLDTIAVATGLSTLDELRASGATLVVPDLTHPAVAELLQSPSL
jgi:phosphoglycolate phosphatase-like HAD superfamily hydrolase